MYVYMYIYSYLFKIISKNYHPSLLYQRCLNAITNLACLSQTSRLIYTVTAYHHKYLIINFQFLDTFSDKRVSVSLNAHLCLILVFARFIDDEVEMDTLVLISFGVRSSQQV